MLDVDTVSSAACIIGDAMLHREDAKMRYLHLHPRENIHSKVDSGIRILAEPYSCLFPLTVQ